MNDHQRTDAEIAALMRASWASSDTQRLRYVMLNQALELRDWLMRRAGELNNDSAIIAAHEGDLLSACRLLMEES